MILKKIVISILNLLLAAFILQGGAALADDAIDDVKLSAERLPAEWRLSEEIRVSGDTLQQFEARFFSALDGIVNQIFLAGDGSQVQVNYIAGPAPEDTRVIYQNLIEKVGAVNVVVMIGNVVIEVVAGENSQKRQVLDLLPLEPLQKSKLKAINMPADWRIVREYDLGEDQTRLIESKLNCNIDGILNQFILADADRLRINYIMTPSTEDAAKAYKNLNVLVGQVNQLIQQGRMVAEIICQDSSISEQAKGLLKKYLIQAASTPLNRLLKDG